MRCHTGTLPARVPAFLAVQVVFLALLVSLAAGCQPQLSQCEQNRDGTTEAMTLVIDANGYPAYAGQALVQDACTFLCHTVSAIGPARFGAPFHLNFDVVASRTTGPDDADTDAIARVEATQQLIFDHRFDMFRAVEAATMPPGEVGRSAAADAGYRFLAGGGGLPSITSSEGIEIYRSWLACGSPMVLQSADAEGTGAAPGDPCDDTETGALGDHCYYRVTEPLIEATWTAIYDRVIVGGGCLGCHDPDATVSFVEQSALDLSDKDGAYAAMVGVEALGTPCMAEGGADRIIPGDADGSMLIHKFENRLPDGGDICGGPMPLGVPLPQSQIDVVRIWIDDGALDN
ncbi:MAG: hypothetical protein JRH11_23150 [Deltaproteobacteria bacterium]|nr:hypothetical protein [Deltaproteobacteria bacterium]